MSARRDGRAEPPAKKKARWALRGGLVALILVALAYLKCGAGFGLGSGGLGLDKEDREGEGAGKGRGDGTGDGTGMSTKQDEPTAPAKPLVGETPAPARCQLRLDGSGLWQLGSTGQEKMEVAAAVAACKQAGGADVTVTGDARQGAWDELKRALDEEGVASFVRGGGAPAGQ